MQIRVRRRSVGACCHRCQTASAGRALLDRAASRDPVGPKNLIRIWNADWLNCRSGSPWPGAGSDLDLSRDARSPQGSSTRRSSGLSSATMTCAASESPYPAAPRRERSASQIRCVTAMTKLSDQPARLAKAAQRVNATDTDGVLPPHSRRLVCKESLVEVG